MYYRYTVSMCAPDILHIHTCLFSLCSELYGFAADTLLPQCFLSMSCVTLHDLLVKFRMCKFGEIVIRHSVKYCYEAGNLSRVAVAFFCCRLNYSVWFWSFPSYALDLNVIWVRELRRWTVPAVLFLCLLSFAHWLHCVLLAFRCIYPRPRLSYV